MRPDPIAWLSAARCSARTQVTAPQLAALSALPDPAEPIARHLVCELADGHEDVHVALAVASHGGDRWWWLRWEQRRQDVVQIDPCDVTQPDALDPEYCLLPDGHPGSHSFDVEPMMDLRSHDEIRSAQHSSPV